MKFQHLLLLLPLALLAACQPSAPADTPTPDTPPEGRVMGVLTLEEGDIGGLALPPDPAKGISSEIRRVFDAPMEVANGIGKQDGPDYPYIEVTAAGSPLLFFAFDSEDSTHLNQLYIKDSGIQDQYGVRVGDSYETLKSKRNSSLSNSTDLHAHTFVHAEGSRILYEMEGDLITDGSVPPHEITLTDEELKNWTVKYIIWQGE